jgi:hypothetical protein
MKRHPAISMLMIWGICILAFLLLPFVLIGRTLSVWGFLVLCLFIGAFCFGAVSRTLVGQLRAPRVVIQELGFDFGRADMWLTIASLVAIAVITVELFSGNYLDLSAAWEIRADRANNLLIGEFSDSSLMFRIAFLLYPVSYAVIIREIVLRKEINLLRLGLLGGLPPLLMSLVMGGRTPLLYGMILAGVAWRTRRMLMRRDGNEARRPLTPRMVLYGVLTVVGILTALNYFVVVFLIRSESVGGSEGMFDIVGSIWGVTFEGPLADAMISTIGYGNTYLVFVFAWYLVQGLVMSNTIFTDYAGAPHYGIYGLELLTAIARRANGDFVSDRFYSLLDLNVLGFLPSAWGSLFVDFKFFGLPFAFLWGFLAARVYHKCKEGIDVRWFYLAPLVSVGIFFSLINTPLGFGNGLTTHFWVILTFFLMKARPLGAGAPGPVSPSVA